MEPPRVRDLLTETYQGQGAVSRFFGSAYPYWNPRACTRGEKNLRYLTRKITWTNYKEERGPFSGSLELSVS